MDQRTVPTTDYDRSKKTEECGIFQPSGFLDAVFTGEIECWISVVKAGFIKKKALFVCKFNLKLKE